MRMSAVLPTLYQIQTSGYYRYLHMPMLWGIAPQCDCLLPGKSVPSDTHPLSILSQPCDIMGLLSPHQILRSTMVILYP